MKIFLTIVLVFIIADILIVAYVMYRRFRKKMPKKVAEKIRENWKEIIRQKDHSHAIMDADKLLDHALHEMGLEGNLGAKFKKSPHLFKNINDVWAAHKVRNNIAHQINYKVDEQTYKRTMLAFKQAFKDLKIF
ncbi:hypothetical protein KJ742_03720 [Patescibacteria group bacterium]|nr:hypothetical protein [Patescibacteria group bacterium]MBU1683030.1 hypothetical protein [Patescibacteria group bacterium]MBU1935265.1 hypothetical protein [Patescibacteria group bacterium]